MRKIQMLLWSASVVRLWNLDFDASTKVQIDGQRKVVHDKDAEDEKNR